MKLDWLKLINAESGWVSDNYLGYCRLVKLIYHSVTYSKKDDKISPENDVFIINGSSNHGEKSYKIHHIRWIEK